VYIVGTDPPRKVRNLADGKRVVVTGYVSDMISYLQRARIIVAPLMFGAGVQNKILEAMALAKPVITTKLGTEGIDGISGVHYLVAKDPEEFSSTIHSLLKNPSLRVSIGQAANQLVKDKYRWEIVKERLLGEVARVTDG
jgi:glycosyltransferase involved in cell wall biosynthesis